MPVGIIRQLAGTRHQGFHAAVADDSVTGCRVLLAAHAADVALNRVDRIPVRLLHNAHMGRAALSRAREEDDVAPLRLVTAVRRPIGAQALHLALPGLAACGPRADALRNTRIMRTERDEHGTPIGIRRAVPIAIAGIVVLLPRIIDHEALFIVAPADLCRCNGHQIPAPVAGQLRAGDRAPPVALGLPAALSRNQADRRAGRLAAAVDHRRTDGMFAVSIRRKVKRGASALAELHRFMRALHAEADVRLGRAALHGQLGMHGLLPGEGKAAVSTQ